MTDDAPILMRREFGKLVPKTDLDVAALHEFPMGKALRVRVTQPRNVGRLRLYWALLKKVHENMPNPPPLKTLHNAVKVRMGFATPIRFSDGTEAMVPDSIAFDNMEEPQFVEFFERFKTFLCTVVIPGLNSEALEREARLMLGEPTTPRQAMAPASYDHKFEAVR